MTNQELLKLKNQGDVNENQIKDFENRKGMHFTQEYTEFLLKCNGIEFPGPPYEYAVNNGKGSLIQYLSDLEGIYSYYKGYINGEDENSDCFEYQFNHCVVGDDLSGDEIVLITEEGDYYGQIFLWDHESGIGFMEEPYEDVLEELEKLSASEQIQYLVDNEAMFFIAKSFSEFLNQIKKRKLTRLLLMAS